MVPFLHREILILQSIGRLGHGSGDIGVGTAIWADARSVCSLSEAAILTWEPEPNCVAFKGRYGNDKMIRAGHVSEVTRTSGEWVFADVGFSRAARSCGLLVGQGDACEVTFAELVGRIGDVASQQGPPMHLLIEAPLSVAFTALGNPTGRTVERRGTKTRYWYVGLGCGVLMSAMYLLHGVAAKQLGREVRLFEGFASFKTKETRSSHARDVLRLRDVVWEPRRHPGAIVPPEDLRVESSDLLSSAFKVAGMDFGVPPVVRIDG
jgi:hypothetical protein